MHCDHCQTTVVESAPFCPSCGGALMDAPGADVLDPSQAPTVALMVGPCESCGAASLPGSTLCLPCTRAFESILNTPAPMPAPVVPVVAAPLSVLVSVPPPPAAIEAATLLQRQAPALPGAPDRASSPDAATVLTPAVAAAHDEPLADDEEYEDEPDDLMAEEDATVLAVAPPAPAATAPRDASAGDPADWSTPSTSSGEHRAIVALPPWARKGPDEETPAVDAAPAEPPAAEPVPWWERNGQQSPTAAKPEVARYVPPPGVAPPASQSLESTLARQAMRPRTPPVLPAIVPVAARPSGNRSRTMVILAACAGIAAIGTPVMWKFAFASRPTTVSALQMDPVAAAPQPVAPRPERVHGSPAPAAPAPRVYQDLQPAAEPEPAPARVTAAPAPERTHTAPAARPGARKPAVAAPTPEPVTAAPVAAPEPAPLLVATPPPVAAATAAAPAPASVQAEAVPLGQIYEVSQVESRPSVTSRFDPVLPARINATTTIVVIVRVLVSPSGRAVEASPVKNPTNDAGVGAAAAATVRQWGFAPAKKKGQPVSCWVNVGVVFKSASGN